MAFIGLPCYGDSSRTVLWLILVHDILEGMIYLLPGLEVREVSRFCLAECVTL